MMLDKVLLIGTKPMPIGGVTIYNQRLSNQIKEVRFFDYKRNSLFELFKKIPSYKVVHLSCSNPFFRTLIILYCIVIRKKTINTIHGNLGRFGMIKNIFDYASVYLTDIPILLNKKSVEKAIKYNKKSLQQTSFIKPFYKEDPVFKKKITDFIGTTSVFSTNAYDLAFDKDNNEIYGIVQLIRIFTKKRFEKYKLIISTPNENYKNYLNENRIRLPSNILMINEPHSFVQVIKSSDVIIRNTTTDGDPLSVREALFFGKKVLCSNAIERPKGTLVYSNLTQLEEIIANMESYPFPQPPKMQDESEKIKKIYLDLLNK